MTLRAPARAEHVDVVLFEHAEETAFLWALRTTRASAASCTFQRLGDLDERLEAHIDGLREGGEPAWRICEARLDTEHPGEMFAAALLAMEHPDARRVHRLLALAEAVPEMGPGLLGALGWTAPLRRREIVEALLTSDAPAHQGLAFDCCGTYRIDPGERLRGALDARDAKVRGAALRAAGDLGRQDLAAACARRWADPDPACRFAAARASVLFGVRRSAALARLRRLAAAPGPLQRAALELALRALPVAAAGTLLEEVTPGRVREPWVIQLAGDLGDPSSIPGLIGPMSVPALARAAAEAFGAITGVDLAAAGLDCPPPPGFDPGPTDDPEDPDVELDPDAGSLWPDATAVGRWWQANGERFSSGTRYLGGRGPTAAWCREVLCQGPQRLRAIAATHLALLEPGAHLFPTEAPVSDQRRSLTEHR